MPRNSARQSFALDDCHAWDSLVVREIENTRDKTDLWHPNCSTRKQSEPQRILRGIARPVRLGKAARKHGRENENARAGFEKPTARLATKLN